MKPNKQNFCGGNFQDWLEVNLTDKCNGRCSWCIEKHGMHPSFHASWKVVADQAISSGKKNIILLGGEPTLHPNIKQIVERISSAGRQVWITTNGGRLTEKFITSSLCGVFGVNISIHDFDLNANMVITGVKIKRLPYIVASLHEMGASVRFNCNCIKGHIDSEEKINQYILWAKDNGADKIRFAELKMDDNHFVDLTKILNYKYGVNDNPFIDGCNSDAVIHGVPVNFRQMCGLQTQKRARPINPVQYPKSVLYYDGMFYRGWQTIKKEDGMEKEELNKILLDVMEKKITVEAATEKIRRKIKRKIVKTVSKRSSGYGGGGCQY